jgi:putative spermidine/putrescine transport system permease protein
MESRWTRIGLRTWAVLVVLFLYIPIGLIILYAFNESKIQSWPIQHFSLTWFTVAWHDPEVRDALFLSLKAGVLATVMALLLGSAAAFAVHRFRFFGREVVSFLLLLPIALPGIVTGIALNSFFSFNGIRLSIWTIIVGHTTFCIVIVYNNLIARLRRTSSSLLEASMDLGARGWQTFRYITLPNMRTAILAGALLAFALSFDEVIVTIFLAGGVKTLPIWIFQSFRLANQVALVNVAGLVAILLSVIPVYIATRITSDTGAAGRT